MGTRLELLPQRLESRDGDEERHVQSRQPAHYMVQGLGLLHEQPLRWSATVLCVYINILLEYTYRLAHGIKEGNCSDEGIGGRETRHAGLEGVEEEVQVVSPLHPLSYQRLQRDICQERRHLLIKVVRWLNEESL